MFVLTVKHFNAFLNCILQAVECLYRQQWTSDDGLGILIISPTRELAYQTFEVLRKVGHNHEFSAGLIIGGKVCEIGYNAERCTADPVIVF